MISEFDSHGNPHLRPLTSGNQGLQLVFSENYGFIFTKGTLPWGCSQLMTNGGVPSSLTKLALEVKNIGNKHR